MKHTLLILATLCLSGYMHVSLGQNVFKVKAGDYPHKVLPLAEQYQYPDFKRGKVLFFGGRAAEAQLNYSFLSGDILFLKDNKDTLELLDKKMVRVVDINGDIFYNDKKYGFCQLVSNFGDVKLAKKHLLSRIGSEKGGPYGISYTASSVTTYSSFSNEASPATKKLRMDTEALFGHRTLFFFVDKNDNFLIPGKNSIAKLFPRHKAEISTYLKDNPVNYTIEADLERLLDYCHNLQ